MAVATANPGKLYRLSDTSDKAAQPSYTSQVFDTQVRSRWGRPEVDPGDLKAQYQLEARAGNVENPERGWSTWKHVEPGTALGLEPARYVQWRATLTAGGHLDSVAINYLPVNLAPVVDDLVVVPGARVNAASQQPQMPQSVNINFASAQNSAYEANPNAGPLSAIRDKGAVTARWAAHDDNGDELSFALYYRPEGKDQDSSSWRLLKDHLAEHFYTFDASLLPDGAWRMKVVASDEPSHVPGEALTAERESDRFLIDIATPAITALVAHIESGKVHVTATASDPATPIAHAEYSIDAGRWQYVEPVGKLSDALTERYDFTAPVSGTAGHLITLRVYDRYENAIAAKTVAR